MDFDFWSCDLTSCMWQVRGPGFVFWFWPCDPTRWMWRVRGHGLDFGHSLGQFWVHWSGLVFCGMSISRFWLNLVHEVGWFDFWKLMRLGFFFLMVQST